MRYSCEQCRDEAFLRAGDDLSHLERARLEAHLAACPSCRAWADRQAAVVAAARAWKPALSAEGKEAVLERVWARRDPPRARRASRYAAAAWGPAAVSVAAAALVLALAAGRTVTPPPAPRAASAQGEGVDPARPSVSSREPPAESPSNQERAPRLALPQSLSKGQGEPAAPSNRRDAASSPRAARARAGARAAAGAAPAPAPEATSYAQAERALAQDRPDVAARLLEDLIERAPGSADAQLARLELGRLYAGPLADPARAAIHLFAFLDREPDPSARGAARGLLCGLLPPAERGRVCGPGLAVLERE